MHMIQHKKYNHDDMNLLLEVKCALS